MSFLTISTCYLPPKTGQCQALMTSQGLPTFWVHTLAIHLLQKKTKRTLGEDFGMLHVSPFVVDMAPMPSSTSWCLLPQTSDRSNAKFGAAQQIMEDTVCQLSLRVETCSAHHHPLESSWEMVCHFAHEQPAFCLCWTSWISVPSWCCVRLCTCVGGRGKAINCNEIGGSRVTGLE